MHWRSQVPFLIYFDVFFDVRRRKDGYGAWTICYGVHGMQPQMFDPRVVQPNRMASEILNLIDIRGDILFLPPHPDDFAGIYEDEAKVIYIS